MPEQSLKLVPFSNGKPTPWWRSLSMASVIVATGAAILLGVWVYTSRSPATAAAASLGDTAPDAVQQILLSGKPTVIEFGANNCVSCREMKPILHSLALDPRIVVADVDILKEREYISKYQIRLMPTQVFYNAQGEETGRHMGKISAEDILAQLGMTQPSTTSSVVTPKAAL